MKISKNDYCRFIEVVEPALNLARDLSWLDELPSIDEVDEASQMVAAVSTDTVFLYIQDDNIDDVISGLKWLFRYFRIDGGLSIPIDDLIRREYLSERLSAAHPDDPAFVDHYVRQVETLAASALEKIALLMDKIVAHDEAWKLKLLDVLAPVQHLNGKWYTDRLLDLFGGRESVLSVFYRRSVGKGGRDIARELAAVSKGTGIFSRYEARRTGAGTIYGELTKCGFKLPRSNNWARLYVDAVWDEDTDGHAYTDI